MKLKSKKNKLKDIPVYEHLEASLKKTYAQRLQWLEDAVKFARSVRKLRRSEKI